jgi:antitoxin component HigA of HigAB toxin-antitoxin module
MKMKRSKTKEREYQRLVEQESLILEATEMISGLIEESGENRKGLAEKLGRTKGFVTQILSGDRNMTLRTLADFAFALEHRVKMKPVPLVEHGDGGEAAGGEGRAVARVFPGGALIERSGPGQAGETPRRPLAAEGEGSAAGGSTYGRYMNAQADGDWGEKLIWENAVGASTGMAKVAG